MGNAQVQDCIFVERDAFKQTEDESGRVTKKECLWVAICPDLIEFRVTATYVQSFHRISGDVWVNSADQKVVQRVAQDNGLIVFWKDEKTAFVFENKTETEWKH